MGLLKKIFVLGILSLLGWGACGATIAMGRSFLSLQTTLIIHAIAAPCIFGIISFIYFKKFSYTSPLLTATIFVSFVILMDAGLVAPFFEKSYQMFKSLLGTWIPFILIFISSYSVGLLYDRQWKH